MTIDECTDMLWAAARADNILGNRRYLENVRSTIRANVVELYGLGGDLKTARIVYRKELQNRAKKRGTWRITMDVHEGSKILDVHELVVAS